MMKRYAFSAFLAWAAVAAWGQTVGSWGGKLVALGTELTLNLHFSELGDSCWLDSPDQGAFGIPAVVAFNQADSVAVKVPEIGADFSAREAGDSLKGKFRQGFMSFPLTLKKLSTALERPQTPVPPFPYATEELAFLSPVDSASLCGTLTLPEGGRPRAALVMVTGSGQQNRDEEIFGHRPFAVIADFLARQGIATYRYDDRGVGCSEGLNPDLTTLTNRLDAEAALEMLRHRGVADSYGVIGHSEGGSIAFMLAADGAVDFAVSLAGPVVPGDSILANQYRLGAPGITDFQIKQALDAAKEKSKWLAWFIDYDPAEDIAKIGVPLMAINGELDMQVSAAQNLAALRRLLPPGPKNVIREYPGLNHLLQHCTTGKVGEYSQIEETISPEVLADIADWINSL